MQAMHGARGAWGDDMARDAAGWRVKIRSSEARANSGWLGQVGVGSQYGWRTRPKGMK